MALIFPDNPVLGSQATTGGKVWQWDGSRWAPIREIGYTGSVGFQGSIGSVGFTGSSGNTGFQGSTGFSGSTGLYDQTFTVALSNEVDAITTGTSKTIFRAPFAFTLGPTIPRASLSTASSSGLVTVDINLNGTSVLGANKLSIDATEKTSVTAATPTTLATTAIADDAEISFDVDAAGTGALGLKVTLYFRRS